MLAGVVWLDKDVLYRWQSEISPTSKAFEDFQYMADKQIQIKSFQLSSLKAYAHLNSQKGGVQYYLTFTFCSAIITININIATISQTINK